MGNITITEKYALLCMEDTEAGKLLKAAQDVVVHVRLMIHSDAPGECL